MFGRDRMTLAGTLIAESLRVRSVLEDIALTVAKISRSELGDVAAGQPRTWTLVEFDAADEDADRLANALERVLEPAGGWYCDFHNDQETFVVFAGRTRGCAKRRNMPIPPRRAHKAGTKFLSEVLARNARQIRGLQRLSQDDVAQRMTTLGHAWSRQTTSDVERGLRNVTVDELIGLALVLGESIGRLLDPAANRPAPDLRTAIDPGDPDIPYIGPKNADDAWPKELPGTNRIGIPRVALRALLESRLVLRIAWDDGPTGINIESFGDDLEDFIEIVHEFRRRGREQEKGQHEGNDLETRKDMDIPVPRDAGLGPSSDLEGRISHEA